MRAFVKQSFRDKRNGRFYKRRDIISLSKERFEELNKAGFVAQAETGAKLSPRRNDDGECIICNKK